MADFNTILAGSLKYREGKRWKPRWCIIRKLSPVADRLHISLYKSATECYSNGQEKGSVPLDGFCGIQSGFPLDKEHHVMAIVCLSDIILLAFQNRETQRAWEITVRSHLGEENQYAVQLVKAPPQSKFPLGSVKLLIQSQRLCITLALPPKVLGWWQLSDIRRFGVIDGTFCLEAGARSGKVAGVFAFASEDVAAINSYLQDISQSRPSRSWSGLGSSHSISPGSRRLSTSSSPASSSAISSRRKDFSDSQVHADQNFISKRHSKKSGSPLAVPGSRVHYATIQNTAKKPLYASTSGLEYPASIHHKSQLGDIYEVTKETYVDSQRVACSDVSAAPHTGRQRLAKGTGSSTVPRKFSYGLGSSRTTKSGASSKKDQSRAPTSNGDHSVDCANGHRTGEVVYASIGGGSADNGDYSEYVSTVQRSLDILSPKLKRCDSETSGHVGYSRGQLKRPAKGVTSDSPAGGRDPNSCVFQSHGQSGGHSPAAASGDVAQEILKAYSGDSGSCSCSGSGSNKSRNSSGSTSSTRDLAENTPTLTCSVGSLNTTASKAGAASNTDKLANARHNQHRTTQNHAGLADSGVSSESNSVRQSCSLCASDRRCSCDQATPRSTMQIKAGPGTPTNPLTRDASPHLVSSSPSSSSSSSVKKAHGYSQPLHYIDLQKFDGESQEVYVRSLLETMPAAAADAKASVRPTQYQNIMRHRSSTPGGGSPSSSGKGTSLRQGLLRRSSQPAFTTTDFGGSGVDYQGFSTQQRQHAPGLDVGAVPSYPRSRITTGHVAAIHGSLKRGMDSRSVGATMYPAASAASMNGNRVEEEDPSRGGAYVTLRNDGSAVVRHLNRGRSLDDVLDERSSSPRTTRSDIGRSGLPAPSTPAPSTPIVFVGGVTTDYGVAYNASAQSCRAEPVYATPVMRAAAVSATTTPQNAHDSCGAYSHANVVAGDHEGLRADYMWMNSSRTGSSIDADSAVFCAVQLPPKRRSSNASLSSASRGSSFTTRRRSNTTTGAIPGPDAQYMDMSLPNAERSMTWCRSSASKDPPANSAPSDRPKLLHSKSLENELDGGDGYLDMSTPPRQDRSASTYQPKSSFSQSKAALLRQRKSFSTLPYHQAHYQVAAQDRAGLAAKPFENLLQHKHYADGPRTNAGQVSSASRPVPAGSTAEKAAEKSSSDEEVATSASKNNTTTGSNSSSSTSNSNSSSSSSNSKQGLLSRWIRRNSSKDGKSSKKKTSPVGDSEISNTSITEDVPERPPGEDRGSNPPKSSEPVRRHSADLLATGPHVFTAKLATDHRQASRASLLAADATGTARTAERPERPPIPPKTYKAVKRGGHPPPPAPERGSPPSTYMLMRLAREGTPPAIPQRKSATPLAQPLYPSLPRLPPPPSPPPSPPPPPPPPPLSPSQVDYINQPAGPNASRSSRAAADIDSDIPPPLPAKSHSRSQLNSVNNMLPSKARYQGVSLASASSSVAAAAAEAHRAPRPKVNKQSAADLSLDSLSMLDDDDVFEDTPPSSASSNKVHCQCPKHLVASATEATPGEQQTRWQTRNPNLTVCILRPPGGDAGRDNGSFLEKDCEVDSPRALTVEQVRRSRVESNVSQYYSSSNSCEGSDSYCEDHDVTSPAITTMRPRFGKEYKRIDRKKLAEDLNIPLESGPESAGVSPLTGQSPATVAGSNVFTFNVGSASGLSRCNSSASGRSATEPDCACVHRHMSVSSHHGHGHGHGHAKEAAYVNICYSSRTSSPHIVECTPPGSPGALSNISQASDALLNYAEIDHSTAKARRPLKKQSGVEYAFIDMVATAAASRVGREHAQLREDSLWRKDRRLEGKESVHQRGSFRDRRGTATASSSKSLGRTNSLSAKDRKT